MKTPSVISVAPDVVSPPAWVGELLGRSQTQNGYEWFTRTIPGAARMGDAEFCGRTTALYGELLENLRAAGRLAVRFWNYVPNINAPASEHRDRYMVFNAGRYDAYVRAYGGPATFDRRVATASCVGWDGDDLVVHCLAAKEPGRPFDNPRQVAPYHYSKRFGPLPPCFARAMLLAGTDTRRTLLVGGTAAIRGEDSVYREDLTRQARETFTNLAALVATASGVEFSPSEARTHLTRYAELRAYFTDAEFEARVARMVQENFPNLRRLELLRADLCRPELLVEIEGVAELA